jgi:hypothetical protein
VHRLRTLLHCSAVPIARPWCAIERRRPTNIHESSSCRREDDLAATHHDLKTPTRQACPQGTPFIVYGVGERLRADLFNRYKTCQKKAITLQEVTSSPPSSGDAAPRPSYNNSLQKEGWCWTSPSRSLRRTPSARFQPMWTCVPPRLAFQCPGVPACLRALRHTFFFGCDSLCWLRLLQNLT